MPFRPKLRGAADRSEARGAGFLRARISLGALTLVLIGGCAAYGIGLGGPGRQGLAIERDQYVAPASVLHVQWRRQIVEKTAFFAYKPQEFAAAAVSSDGKTVFIGSSAKTFYALSRQNGEVLWKRDLNGGISSEPLYLAAGQAGPEALVLVGDDDGQLNALDAKTGAQRWVYRGKGPIHVRPRYHGGLLFFTSGEGRLYALDAKTGAWRWQYERETPETFGIRGQAGALPVGNRVYAGFPDGYLACLSVDTGEVLWTRQLSGSASRFTDVDSTPILLDDTLYVTCYSTGVFALDAKDGSTRWRFEMEAAGQLSVDPNGERIYVTSASQGLFSLDRQGHKLWQQALSEQGELSYPTLWGRYLLLSAAAGGLYIVDRLSGQLLQYFDPGQGISGRPVAHGRDVYLLSNVGAVFALSAT